MTREEKKRLNALAQLPCLIGNADCGGRGEIHHLTDSGRRLGHMQTVKLCFNHHQAQSPLAVGEAYHKGTKRFKEKYGSNAELLAKQNHILEGIYGTDFA